MEAVAFISKHIQPPFDISSDATLWLHLYESVDLLHVFPSFSGQIDKATAFSSQKLIIWQIFSQLWRHMYTLLRS